MATLYRGDVKWLGCVLALGAVAAACGGGGGNGGTPPSTTVIAKASASGDGQTGAVGQPLANPLQVVVTEDGAASAGATVTWSTTAANSSMNPTSARTDANGVATSEWTLGRASGSQSAQASLSGASGSPVAFTATASPGSAATLSKAGGDAQTGTINTQLAGAVQAKVSDQFGNGVPGVDVAWTASGATPSSASVPTDGSGVSAVNVTLGGTTGAVTITATSGTLAGSPQIFSATAEAVAPIPASAAITVGNDLFQSNRNNTQNPAVDTVAVGGTVTWTWVQTGTVSHSVRSLGSPGFTSSAIKTGNGQTYAFTFATAGTYLYDCQVHGSAMTGRIVVR